MANGKQNQNQNVEQEMVEQEKMDQELNAEEQEPQQPNRPNRPNRPHRPAGPARPNYRPGYPPNHPHHSRQQNQLDDVDIETTINNLKYIIDGIQQVKPIIQNIGPLLGKLRGKSVANKKTASKRKK